MKGLLFVISAPSGAGKSTVVREVRKRTAHVGYSVSHTTRKPRAGELEGRDYYFVDKKTFKKMVAEGSFVEWANVYEDYYGSSLSALEGQLKSGLDILLDLDIQGARAIRNHSRDSVLIFLVPPSLEVLERRLRERGTDSEEAIETRLRAAMDEIAQYDRYDYVVVNDDLEKAVTEVQAIILAERCRSGRREPTIKEFFGF